MTNTIQNNISLRPYNTFGIDVRAASFARFSSQKDLASLLNQDNDRSSRILILGGGSNILFTSDFNGLVLKCDVPGIGIVSETDEEVLIRAGAGVSWHQFVVYCMERNLGGIENLVMIPGTCGAAPVQNIGAYGVELKDLFEQLDAFHLDDRKLVRFTREECGFGYRKSVFKNKHKNEFAILNITLRLSKRPRIDISYGAIRKELERMDVRTVQIRDVAKAVMNIRSEKLPDPALLGNAGSFFKNPEVDNEQHAALQREHPDIVSFSVQGEEGRTKLAAGWMIEQCGWKGRQKGRAACYEKQALIIVNQGGATGSEILDLSEEIVQDVRARFGITLEREVDIH